ncbi:hypothetical protein ACT453_29045, partial [Bacillus sp. D-CC]
MFNQVISLFEETFSKLEKRIQELEHASKKEITASGPFLYASKMIFRSIIPFTPCLIYSVFTNGRHMKLVKLKKDTKRWLSSYQISEIVVKLYKK